MSIASPEPPARPLPSAPADGPVRRILIVDDDEMICEAMEMTLHRRGLEITWRTSPLDAFELVAEQDFDVVLTDLSMAAMNGIELCKRILLIRPDASVLVLTGLTDVETRAAALGAGASEVLVKPLDAKGLRLAVSRALERRGMTPEQRARLL